MFNVRNFLPRAAAVALAILLGACGAGQSEAPTKGSDKPEAASAASEASESARLYEWFEKQFEAEVARSPMYQTYLGRKTNYDKWDDETDAFAVESYELAMASYREMLDSFDVEDLSNEAALSYRLYAYDAERSRENFPFRNHNYVFSQFRGPHSSVPAFLINQHAVETLEDASAYVRRLEGVDLYLRQHQERAEAQFSAGIVPPKWAYPQMIATSRNIITGAPFDDGPPSTLLSDFTKKIDALSIPEAEKDDLKSRAEAALLSYVKPAYERLIAMFETQVEDASIEDGAWKLPNGAEYYETRLRLMTTTDLTADEIHELGLRETARIHNEMNAIKENVGFDGSLQDFFAYMREDPDGKFTYPDTDEGREKYLSEATALIDTMRGRLDELFLTTPKADIVVKRVEPFREKSAGKAFYQRPAADGSRPGIYYANLADMANMPTYQMEALAYHEGIPGHHMQIAISQELADIPNFRKFGRFTAYSEGWGLYSEFIPKEMGFYDDPYRDFGRLAMELWRAGRLVVDTGIHSKKWSREDAMAWLQQNTPNPLGDIRRSTERYVVMPGQATAYKIGMLKILELRDRAENALGEDFDVREFHDVILASGPLPLAILEENVDSWIAAKKGA
ncbi:MAG: DUF885 family protein [Alphaproteobacteria bacterium]|nr:DUF885 family protein [Alphaproteobacteria bacterium]